MLGLLRLFLFSRRLVFKISVHSARAFTSGMYCNVFAYPHYAYQCEMLEQVQRRAMKMVNGLSSLEYPDRLKSLGLPSRYYRRARVTSSKHISMLRAYKTFNQCLFFLTKTLAHVEISSNLAAVIFVQTEK